LNIKPCMGHISGTWELLLCEYWRKSMIIGEKKTDLKRLTRATKTSLFDRNWATSLKPRRRSRPLRLVWWALLKGHFFCCVIKNLISIEKTTFLCHKCNLFIQVWLYPYDIKFLQILGKKTIKRLKPMLSG
jgi:hypothetical protein